MPINMPPPSDNYERPPAGMHNAVCVHVADIGLVETEYNGEKKEQYKIDLYWQIDPRNAEGKRHTLRKRYTLSSHENATLRKDLESWRGQPFALGELEKGFDVEKLVGVPCTLQVAHETSKNNKTYANVKAVLPYDSRLGAKLQPEEFTLPKPREPQASVGFYPPAHEREQLSDVPF